MEGEKPGLVRVYPKSNCPRCYGRGYIGHDQQGGRVECSCLVRKKAHIPPDEILDGLSARDLIASFRGGIPIKCDFCGGESQADDMEPEEGGQWACITCWNRFREEDRAGVEAKKNGRG